MEKYQLFIKVGKVLNFTKVAEQSGLAPSSVMRRMDQLEEELSTKLFVRSTRSLKLTQEGASYLSHLEPIIANLERLNRGMTRRKESVSGRIRINVFASFGSHIVIPAMRDLMQTYPELEFDINLDNDLRKVSSDFADIAIRIGRAKDSSFIHRPIAKLELEAWASEAYLYKYGHPKSPRDLKDHECLQYSRQQKENWTFVNQKTQNSISIPVSNRITTLGGDGIHSLIQNDLGIGLLPVWMTKTVSMKPILPQWTISFGAKSPLSIYGIYHPNLRGDRRVVLTLDAIKTELKRKTLDGRTNSVLNGSL